MMRIIDYDPVEQPWALTEIYTAIHNLQVLLTPRLIYC